MGWPYHICSIYFLPCRDAASECDEQPRIGDPCLPRISEPTSSRPRKTPVETQWEKVAKYLIYCRLFGAFWMTIQVGNKVGLTWKFLWLVGRICSYLLPKRHDGTLQIYIKVNLTHSPT